MRSDWPCDPPVELTSARFEIDIALRDTLVEIIRAAILESTGDTIRDTMVSTINAETQQLR